MIPLLPIEIKNIDCSRVNIKDTTDYKVGSGNYDFTAFENGIRIIRITYPDGTYKFYSTFTNVNALSGIVSVPGSGVYTNPNPVNLNITALGTTITTGNNTTANWDFDLLSGDYTVDIISIPYVVGFPFSYASSSAMCILTDEGRIVIMFAVKINNFSGYYVPCNLTEDLKMIPLDINPDPWSGGITDLNFSNINSISFTVNCDTWTNIECIFGKYEEAFCKSCGCDCICKDKKSGNILKATMLLRELELLEDNQTEYQKKLELYTPILNTLCHCS